MASGGAREGAGRKKLDASKKKLNKILLCKRRRLLNDG